MPAPGGLSPRAILTNVGTGVSVVLGELKWLVARTLRGVEISQMRRRLELEHRALGQAVAEGLDRDGADFTPGEALVRRAKQAAFLAQELDNLTCERTRARRDQLRERAKDMDHTG